MKQNNNNNKFTVTGINPYYPRAIQLLIYLNQSALAESKNLYLQSLMVMASILGTPIPLCLVLWSLSAGPVRTSSEAPVSFHHVNQITQNDLSSSQPRLFNTSSFPRGLQIQTSPSLCNKINDW